MSSIGDDLGGFSAEEERPPEVTDDESESNHTEEEIMASSEIEVRRSKYEEEKRKKALLGRKRKREESKAYLKAEPRLPSRGPRLLEDLDMQGSILCAGQSYAFRDEAELVIAEYCEYVGARYTCKKSILVSSRKTHDSLVLRCDIPICCFEVRVRKRKDSRWHLICFKPHSCVVTGNVRRRAARKASTAYKIRFLLPICIPLVREDYRVKPRVLSAALQPYLRLMPPVSLIRRLKSAAIESLRGDALESTTKLPALCHALNEMGHKARILYATATEMRQSILRIARNEHDHSQRRLLSSQRADFDANAIELPSIPENARFALGFLFAPKKTLDVGLEKFVSVSFSDGAHMHSETQGTLFSIYTIDADHHCVPVVPGVVCDNECVGTWKEVFEFTKCVYPAFDIPERRHVLDGEKGCRRAWDELMEHAKTFTCSRHRAGNVCKNVRPHGGQAKRDFERAVRSPTIQKLQEVKNAMTEETRAYLGGMLDREQYMCCAKRMYGHHNTSVVESMNNANLDVRSMHIYGAFMELVRSEQERFVKRKTRALDCNSALPPAIGAKLSNTRHLANAYTSIEFTSDENINARVPSSSDPAISYNTDLSVLAENGRSCDCGRPQVEGLPCAHLIAHADAAGLDISSFMCRHDTCDGWREQYPEDLQFPVPSDSAIERSTYIDSNLRPPIRAKRRRGRPRTRRHRSALEGSGNGGQGRRTVTCSNCYLTGHNRRSCPGMPSQIAETS